MRVEFEAPLWVWDARRGDTWTFVSLPVPAARDIRDRAAGNRRGFGSVRVRATIGASTWTTSIFPDAARDTYVLPVKRAIRAARSLAPGDTVPVAVEVLDL